MQENLNVSATTSNRISGYCYDAAGNLLQQGTCPSGPPYTYTYNAVNQITLTAGVTYSYDGDGRRVEKSGGTIYWYGMSSDTFDETDLSGNLKNEYVFFGGKRIARRDSSGNIFYYFADHLGTSREIVQAGQSSPCYDADFFPFGGERTPIVNSCSTSQNYKFTGKERDSESGLDDFGARYYSSQFGRFISPDPVMLMRPRIFDPQQWNMYAYVRNNPLRLIDHNGKWPTDIHNQIIDRAFPGLSNAQRQILKNASAAMDQCISCQSHGNAYQHAMRAPGENIDKAKSDTQNFISGKEAQATKAMNDSKTTTANGLTKDALTAVGDALHTESDKTSPAHTDAQGNPREWIISDFHEHNKEEETISPAQMDLAVKAEQQAFQKTFGKDIANQATTPPQTHKDPQ